MNLPTKLLVCLAVLIVVTASSYGCWRLYRWAHWTWGYEDMVEDKIRETVKPECRLPN